MVNLIYNMYNVARGRPSDGALLAAQKKRLLQAAASCPVKKMLTGGMRDGITTTLR